MRTEKGLLIMSVNKHLEAKGVVLSDDNSLPQGQRTQKSVKRLIAAVRAAEGEFNDELRNCNVKCLKAQDRVTELQDRVRELEAKLLKFQLTEKVESMHSISADDKQLLLADAV